MNTAEKSGYRGDGNDTRRPRRTASTRHKEDEEAESISKRKRKRTAAMRPVQYCEVEDNTEDLDFGPEIRQLNSNSNSPRASEDLGIGHDHDHDHVQRKAYKYQQGMFRATAKPNTGAHGIEGSASASALHSDDEDEDHYQLPTSKKVDMQYLAKSGVKVKRFHFDNVASASRKTGVNAHLIEGVCDDGGGFLGGSWFCYYQHNSPRKQKDCFRPITFDVSKLKPLNGEFIIGRWWNRVIELICKKTEKVLLSFPSTEYAAVALGKRAHQVRRACNSYATGQQYDFDSHMLRFRKESSVYVFGSSPQDFEEIIETHEQRMERWRNLLARGHRGDTDTCLKQKQDDAVVQAALPKKKKVKVRNQEAESNPKEEKLMSPRQKLLHETLECFGTSFKPSPQGPFDGESTRLCIFCQESSSEIIFEPCGHCLVCETCAAWSCRKFCPCCRCAISKRKRSTSIFRGIKVDLALKPLVFSPYSFMDIS